MLTLERKGYIVRIKDYQYELTIVGRDALDEIGKVKIVDDTPTVLATAEEPIQTVTTDNTATAILGNLHKELQNKLFELTGMRQAKGYSNSSFIPSARDLEYQLIKFKRVYKELWDVNKIRKCLIAHVETCARTGVYTPVLKYYIFKDEKGSQLAADLEAYQETTETQHKIKNTKDMFG